MAIPQPPLKYLEPFPPLIFLPFSLPFETSVTFVSLMGNWCDVPISEKRREGLTI